jgi:two-component system nitrogen regulation sensor histidine kinase NtrY
MEEHGGELDLTDAPDSFDGGRGAMVRLIFPMSGMLPGPASAGVAMGA